MYYKDVEYARGRLKNSVVNLDYGKPVYVIEIESSDEVIVQFLREESRARVNLKDLDLTPVKLGWVNCKGHVIYAARVPIRGVWRQGLCKDNVKLLAPSSIHARCNIPSPELGETIVGNYPTFKQALASIKTTTGIAFSRNWALSGTNLLYKGRVVGTYVDGKLSLNRQNEYLEDVLQEDAGVGCGYC